MSVVVTKSWMKNIFQNQLGGIMNNVVDLSSHHKGFTQSQYSNEDSPTEVINVNEDEKKLATYEKLNESNKLLKISEE